MAPWGCLGRLAPNSGLETPPRDPWAGAATAGGRPDPLQTSQKDGVQRGPGVLAARAGTEGAQRLSQSWDGPHWTCPWTGSRVGMPSGQSGSLEHTGRTSLWASKPSSYLECLVMDSLSVSMDGHPRIRFVDIWATPSFAGGHPVNSILGCTHLMSTPPP